jgi:hypothetical protein
MPQSPPRLLWIEHRNSWQTPPVSHYKTSVDEASTQRVHIGLLLEDGSLLELPMTQGTIDGLAESFALLATPKSGQ